MRDFQTEVDPRSLPSDVQRISTTEKLTLRFLKNFLVVRLVYEVVLEGCFSATSFSAWTEES